MTVADLLAKPHLHHAKVPTVTEETVPEIVLEWNGRGLTRREAFCLFTHVFLDDVRAVLPAEWRDPLGIALLEFGDRTSPWGSFAAINRVAGPRTVSEIRDRIRSGRLEQGWLFYMLEPLLAQDWLSTLPLFAQAIAPRALHSHYKNQIEPRLDQFREQQGIAADTWELLMIPEPEFAPERIGKSRASWAAKLEELMRRGVRLSARDFRRLADHPIHGENLRGLILMIQHEDSTRIDAWPFALGDKDTVSIAHPSLLDPREHDQWTARMIREGRVAPFDQWNGAGKPLKVDVTGLGADPSDLMLHLETRGWHRGRPGRDGVIRSHWKPFSDLSLRAVVEYPGIPTKYGGGWSFQTVTNCRFEQETGERIENERVSPIAVSVVRDDLEGLK
jgi:hypothetical protein